MSNFSKVNEEVMSIIAKEGYYSPVTEAYYGKSKELKKMEAEFNVIVKEVRSVWTSKFDIQGFHEACQKVLVGQKCRIAIHNIEELTKKQFGFGYVNLIFNESMTSMGPNAFTLTSGVIRRLVSGSMMNIAPLKQGEKYYDVSHSYTLTVVMLMTLFDCEDLTGGELLAAYLHEIGHNFQCTPMANVGLFVPYLSLLEASMNLSGKAKENMVLANMFNILIQTEVGADIFGMLLKIQNLIYEAISTVCKPIRQFFDWMDKTFEILNLLQSGLIPFIKTSMLFNYSLYTLKRLTPVGVLHMLSGYSGEVFADSFAVAYGYGPELSSFLKKLGTTVEIDYNVMMNTPLAPIYEVSLITYEVMRDIFCLDPHPSDQRRILNTIEKLEREINGGKLPPELKKSALADLKHTKKVYESFLKAETQTKQFALLACYRQMNDSVFGGKLDFKHIVNKIVNLGQYEA